MSSSETDSYYDLATAFMETLVPPGPDTGCPKHQCPYIMNDDKNYQVDFCHIMFWVYLCNIITMTRKVHPVTKLANLLTC